MSDSILAVLITGAVSMLCTFLSARLTQNKLSSDMDKKIAVIETKMDGMKEDIATHNGYAKMFSEKIPAITQHMADVDRRLENIERKGNL